MDEATYTPAYPEACPRCTSGMSSYSGGPQMSATVSYGCGTRWVGTSEGQTTEIIACCEEGADPVCVNCDGGGCVCVVVRDWDSAQRCDGKCCPDCDGSGIHGRENARA